MGRPLRPARKKALDHGLKELGIQPEQLEQPRSVKPESLFNHPYQNYVLEIGFGDGIHLTGMMELAPETGFLGAEPFINGMSSFLKDAQGRDLLNARVYMNDALHLVHALTNDCLDEIYILNPDPWHKKRHHKRRIVNTENLDEFARILKPGGKLILSTDVPYLAEWMFVHSYNHPSFEWEAEKAQDWKKAPDGWITTTYETKKAKGADQMSYLIFKKKS